MVKITPTRETELQLLRRFPLVAGIDEVGRGALAGPVTVGVAVVDPTVGEPPVGLADSKLLSAAKREALVPAVESWVSGWALGSASAAEIDAFGIVPGLRLAGRRALAQLADRGLVVPMVILDGHHNWLALPQDDLLSTLADPATHRPQADYPEIMDPKVLTQIKGDARCAVVAAASVLAKVARDQVMTELPDPGYGWATNKGYSTLAHISALTQLGASEYHRKSWRLPGLSRGSLA